jgi:hypothetical protein
MTTGWNDFCIDYTAYYVLGILLALNLILNEMENLKEKLEIVVHYMNNMEEFKGEFWENLKAIKLEGKDEQYINDISDLIDEWIDNGMVAFYSKYGL